MIYNNFKITIFILLYNMHAQFSSKSCNDKISDHVYVQSSINRNRRKDEVDNNRNKRQSILNQAETSSARNKRYLILKEERQTKHART
jgi:hypothetical protein